MKYFKLIWLIPMVVLFSNAAHSFVGGMTVALGRTAQMGEVKTPFSADALVNTEQNQATSHVYYSPGMVRDDMDMGGQKMTSIQRYDLGKVWILMGPGMYMEQKIGESAQAPEYKLVERTELGKDTVNGMDTTKYKTVYEGPDGRFAGITWFTDDNIAVKGDIVSESKGENQRILFTLSNLKRGKQPASLFELPKGARRFDIPNMAGMTGMTGGSAAMPMTRSQPAPMTQAASTTQAAPPLDKSRLSSSYLNGTWCSSWSVNSERGLYAFDKSGSYQIGTPSGGSYQLRPGSGGNLQHFHDQFNKVVSFQQNQFTVLDNHNRQLTFVRGNCDGGAANGVVQSTAEAARKGTEEATVESVYHNTKDAVTKGINKLFNW